MKYSIWILFFSIMACTKHASKVSSDLNGTWELISSDDGWNGHLDYPAGNGNTFEFNGNTYIQIIKSTDTAYKYSGTFEIYNGKPCDIGMVQTVIKFDEDLTASSFSKSDITITLSSSECIADGQTKVYQKVQ